MNLLSRVFNYELPTEIVFGVNAIQELPQWIGKLKGSRVFVVSDPGVESAGILQKVMDPLSSENISFQSFIDVDREPDVKTISKATDEAKEFGADLVLGVGGGERSGCG